MKLSDLVKGMFVENGIRALDPIVLGITHDSRKVQKGYLFVALKGQSFNGNHFVAQAIEKGCVGVVSEEEIPVPRREIYVQPTLLLRSSWTSLRLDLDQRWDS